MMLCAGWFHSIARAEPIDEAGKAHDAKDYKKAFRIYNTLALKGDTTAQVMLGLLYHGGKGVPRNYAEAFKWLRKPAGQGNALAQFTLGDMITRNAIRQDKKVRAEAYIEAYMWFSLSAAQGYPEETVGIRLDLLELHMNPEDILEAQKRAASWKRER